MSKFSPSRLLAAAALAVAGFGAQAANLTLHGTLGYNTDVVRIDFTLASAGSVSIWTDSWLAGLNFDPTLSLFASSGNLIVTGDDTADPALLHPGQGGYDSSIDIGSLAAGRYFLALTASGNDPLGLTFGDGFSLGGTTPIPIASWTQPSSDINANDQKGGSWNLHLNGATTAVVAVPEPADWALLAIGLVALAGYVSKRAKP